jgi:putative MATE family efflux protein
MSIFKRYIGNKEFYKELLIVASPIAFQQFVSSIVNALDTFMVSSFDGSTATAAVSIANRYFNSFNAILIAIAISCSVFIAQFFGAKRQDRLKQMFGINLIVISIFAILAFLIGYFFNEQIIDFLIGAVKQDDVNSVNYRKYAIDYLSIVVISFLPLAITNALTFTFRPIKMTKVPLISAFAAAFVNAIGNYILINGYLGFPVLGVKGAAIATLISRFVELAILVIYYYIKKPPFYGKLKEIFSIPKILVEAVFERAKALVFAQFLTQMMFIIMMFVYARLDEGNPTIIASISVTQTIVDLVIVLVGGMGTAASILVGTRLGAGKIQEARDNARWQLAYVFVFSILSGLVMIALIPLVGPLFGFKEHEIGLLRTIMILYALSLPFMFYAINVIFVTRAGGYTKAPIFISNIVYYCIKLPIILLFVFVIPEAYEKMTFLHTILASLGLDTSIVVFIFMLERISEVIRAIVAFYIYTHVNWWSNINKTV